MSCGAPPGHGPMPRFVACAPAGSVGSSAPAAGRAMSSRVGTRARVGRARCPPILAPRPRPSEGETMAKKFIQKALAKPGAKGGLHRSLGVPAGKKIGAQKIAQAREGSSRIMALLLAAVASISLLVGGIGIMNILLVSVTERTREIGIRMAIGAQRVHVLLQFLTEAVLLSAAGGVGGILVGIVISHVISHVAEWPTLVSPLAVAGGFWFSAAVGIFFGFYPARKAAHLDPIEALRYE